MPCPPETMQLASRFQGHGPGSRDGARYGIMGPWLLPSGRLPQPRPPPLLLSGPNPLSGPQIRAMGKPGPHGGLPQHPTRQQGRPMGPEPSGRTALPRACSSPGPHAGPFMLCVQKHCAGLRGGTSIASGDKSRGIARTARPKVRGAGRTSKAKRSRA